MEIEEGKERKINEYRFEGDTSMFADDTVWGFINEQDVIRASFEQFPWWNPVSWFTDAPATEQAFAEACEKIRELYRNKGYLDVEVEMPHEEVGADGKIDRVFKINAGPRYIVGTLSVTGVKNYPADLVMASVKNISPGDVASDAALQEAARSIEVFCGSGTKALSDTRVSIRRIPVENQQGVIDIVFSVKEGYPVKIRNVVVRGNDYTKDKVIRREINLSPGDPMLADKAETSKRRLENLRYFERVRYYLEPVAGADAKEGESVPRDLVYEVAEKNTGNFMVGVGASSVDSVFGTIELSESNFDLFNPWRFRGGGQKGRISLMAGPRYQSYEASVVEPYFLDRMLELSVTLYRRQRWYDDYDIIRNGINVQIAYPVKFWPSWQAFGRMGIGAGLEFIEFDDVENTSWYITGNEQEPVKAFKMEAEKYGDSWEVPLEIFWSNDTRDSFIFATRGYKAKVFGDIVGGDNQYWRVGFDYRHYFPVWKRAGHVFSFGVHGATEDTFSDEMPIYNRFFLGGPRNIRGVEFREIAPWIYSQKGKKGKHVPWGGQTLWYMNLEYTIPLVKFLRFAAFSDLGSVGEDDWDFDTDYFCWSAGVGLRIDLPQFPIRLDVATPIDKKSGTDREVFSFTIGYDF
jgi:outer membrane protein insertion porin family